MKAEFNILGYLHIGKYSLYSPLYYRYLADQYKDDEELEFVLNRNFVRRKLLFGWEVAKCKPVNERILTRKRLLQELEAFRIAEAEDGN